MIYTIKNEQFTMQIESFGAEIKSIIENATGKEYMWDSDNEYWAKTSPILFPFVGAVRDGKYTYEGISYQMGRHGFARDMEFAMVDKKESEITFALESTNETLAKYPFAFRFEIIYKLEGRSAFVQWRVVNKNEKTMYFSLGGHPAFACPIEQGLKRTDCFIKFHGANEINITVLDGASGLITGENKTYPLKDELLEIDDTLFDDDALIIENNQSHEVSLCGPDKKEFITVKFDAPLFGVWSFPDSDASYVCIEPWYGRCDSMTFEGTLEERDWTNSVEAGEIFERGYEIYIH